MTLLTSFDTASTHRDIAIAILDAHLPHGAISELAKRAGFTKQWLANIRQAGSFSMPSRKAAKLIANNLSASPYYKSALYYHLVEARKAYEGAKKEMTERVRLQLPISVYVGEIETTFKSAYFYANPVEMHQQLKKILDMGGSLLSEVQAQNYPADYLKICSVLAHANYLLNCVPAGLYWAKLGRIMADRLEDAFGKAERAEMSLSDWHFILARDEAIGYNNMALAQTAQVCYERAEKIALESGSAIRLADVYRNRLLSLSKVPRFTIGDAENLAYRAREVFERTNDYLSYLLNDIALSRAYIAYGGRLNLKKAGQLLADAEKRLNRLPNAGQIHRVVVLTEISQLNWQKRDLDAWRANLKAALKIIKEGGLFHQLDELKKQYGNILDEIDYQ